MANSDLTIRVKDHLLIPFGRPKWDIRKITIASVSTDATYFSSSTPCAYIDVKGGHPLRLNAIETCIPNFPTERIQFDEDDEKAVVSNAALVNDVLIERCNFDSDFEKRFLGIYFRWLVEICSIRGYEKKSPGRIWLSPEMIHGGVWKRFCLSPKRICMFIIHYCQNNLEHRAICSRWILHSGRGRRLWQ